MSAPAPSMFTPAAKQVAASLGLVMGKANLEAFADTLLELARADRDVLAVTSDSRGSGKLGPFAAALPKQIVEVGIAEQNLVGMAAGLASAGKTVFAVSPACFLTARALEQIKNDVAYSDVPVTLVGISAGVSYGALGSTHHSLHDLAALRAVHNVGVVVPADNAETRAAVRAAAESTKPVYLRFGKAAMYDLPRENRDGDGGAFKIGRASVIRDAGNDLAFIATGETVVHALLAAAWLEQEHGVRCRVVSMHTLKPLDTDMILRCADECGGVVTVEEHSVAGGLGEACAGVLMRAGAAVPFRTVGVPDEYTVTGAQADIFRHYGLSMEGLSAVALEMFRARGSVAGRRSDLPLSPVLGGEAG
jgi:transketolase